MNPELTKQFHQQLLIELLTHLNTLFLDGIQYKEIDNKEVVELLLESHKIIEIFEKALYYCNEVKIPENIPEIINRLTLILKD